jgi:hypothetical protein
MLNRQGSAIGKPLFVEPRDGNRLRDVLSNFQRAANRGAALLGVCRGKLSEGLDFADEAARCVCVVGIPFPNASDFRVTLKRQWLDRRSPGSGSRWYTESAMRAVNQAIGRAIRHRTDYAAILLIDERFAGFQNMLSKWIRPSVRMVKRWTGMIDDLREFFARHSHQAAMMFDVPELEPIPARPPPKRPVEAQRDMIGSELFEMLGEVPKNCEKPKPESLELRGLRKKPRAANGAIMQRELERLFASSRTDSEEVIAPMPIRTPEKVQQDDRALSKPAVVVRERPKCAYCKQIEGGMRRMACGHFACTDCFEFRAALGALACPACGS